MNPLDVVQILGSLRSLLWDVQVQLHWLLGSMCVSKMEQSSCLLRVVRIERGDAEVISILYMAQAASDIVQRSPPDTAFTDRSWPT